MLLPLIEYGELLLVIASLICYWLNNVNIARATGCSLQVATAGQPLGVWMCSTSEYVLHTVAKQEVVSLLGHCLHCIFLASCGDSSSHLPQG